MLEHRWKQLFALQEERGWEGCLIEHPIDLFYLTALKLSAGRLVVIDNRATLFVDGRYLEEAKEKSPVPVCLIEDAACREWAQGHKLAFDSAKTSYDQFLKLQEWTDGLLPIRGLLEPLRAIKTEEEKQRLRASAELAWLGFEHASRFLLPGVTEQEIAWEFERFCREHGASSMAFEPIVAFGEATARPHHRASTSRLRKGQLVLIDCGCMLDGYASDMTRMQIDEETNHEILHLYTTVREAHLAALKKCRPGVKLGELDLAARAVMAREGVEELFVHSLGHGIGLETHEYPRISSKGEGRNFLLQEGMVVTIEPGLYLPGVGGVRYEDTVLITADGVENLYAESK